MFSKYAVEYNKWFDQLRRQGVKPLPEPVADENEVLIVDYLKDHMAMFKWRKEAHYLDLFRKQEEELLQEHLHYAVPVPPVTSVMDIVAVRYVTTIATDPTKYRAVPKIDLDKLLWIGTVYDLVSRANIVVDTTLWNRDDELHPRKPNEQLIRTMLLSDPTTTLPPAQSSVVEMSLANDHYAFVLDKDFFIAVAPSAVFTGRFSDR